jgi:hypothetical protein
MTTKEMGMNGSLLLYIKCCLPHVLVLLILPLRRIVITMLFSYMSKC